MNISLTKDLEKLIEKKVKSGLSQNPIDVVRDALRHLEESSEPEWLEQKIQEGLNSGPATPMTKADWDGIRKSGLKRTFPLARIQRRSRETPLQITPPASAPL